MLGGADCVAAASGLRPSAGGHSRGAVWRDRQARSRGIAIRDWQFLTVLHSDFFSFCSKKPGAQNTDGLERINESRENGRFLKRKLDQSS